ncbi:DMT family transporter [Peptoniphilus genitalis]|uniref:DMT family transporter n=1 Tax=Peptoniphilus genitalis TaxID=3036303 RepID=UPI0024AC8C4C|nr:EamA family transporter [Peptoniphilus sp. Marseille-Q7072]
MKNKSKMRGLFFASLGAMSWGISGVCSQYLFMNYNVDSSWLTAIRMVLSGILLLILSAFKDKDKVIKIWTNPKDVGWLFSFSILGLLMCQYTYVSAIKYSDSATATVLQSLNVVIMIVFMSIVTRTKMKFSQVLAVFLAVLGTYLISTGGNPRNMTISTAGLIFGLLSAVGVITYTLFSRPIIVKWGNILVTGWGMLIGGLVISIITKAWIIPKDLDFIAWLMIAIIIVVGTAGGFSIFLEGVKHIGPVKATLIGCLEPASATLLAAIFLGMRFSLVELTGFFCILLTVFLSVKDKEAEN